jgi:hypothetical protein
MSADEFCPDVSSAGPRLGARRAKPGTRTARVAVRPDGSGCSTSSPGRRREVDHIDAVVAELRARGVAFEEVDVPGLRTVGGIAEVEGNYPSAGGVGERAAWFRDSEGNLLGIGQSVT